MPVSDEEVNICVRDVLGPLEGEERVPHWSLLHYSVNLNPALRQQIAADVEGYVSSAELMRIKDDGKAVRDSPESFSLSLRSVSFKSSIIS